ncbi:hypothetical protein G6F50_015949 [Rhizopus delemar]|uniref:Uncharacterized protein n=1 Tax=Rhizopus delemar TaxID=936053 RepID=A0A9P6XVE8_9FUNG|nr:hypothetical protein G6F50_015949 [Rhizopus delemar]
MSRAGATGRYRPAPVTQSRQSAPPAAKGPHPPPAGGAGEATGGAGQQGGLETADEQMQHRQRCVQAQADLGEQADAAATSQLPWVGVSASWPCRNGRLAVTSALPRPPVIATSSDTSA